MFAWHIEFAQRVAVPVRLEGRRSNTGWSTPLSYEVVLLPTPGPVLRHTGDAAGSESSTAPGMPMPKRPRVVGVHSRDPLGDERRHEAEALERSRRERQEGERGRAVDLQGRDLDRGAGQAFSTRRR